MMDYKDKPCNDGVGTWVMEPLTRPFGALSPHGRGKDK